MIYFCFIETERSTTPYMEPIDAETLADARAEAKRLMAQHASAVAARIFLDENEVAILDPRGERS